ncbi:MAG TPA: putative sulfate/molybdate transporter [Alphaproteobacteria bacterium]|nr:putative sulfate/molybdate transporter [Alphaproteobacteria bacterium]
MKRCLHLPWRADRLGAAIRFDRNEFSGAFGDLGTDFPLIVGMILIADLDAASVLIMFGMMQLVTGLLYGIPMPAQPLKAMAVIVITQRLSGNVLYGGGLAIGLIMLVLSVTGLIDRLAKTVPKNVVRGIQCGLGLQLAMLALKDYVPAEGVAGYGLALAAFGLVLVLLGNRRVPPAPFVIGLGVLYAVLVRIDIDILGQSLGISLPRFDVPTVQDVMNGFLVLTLPQIPLSLGNSILATRQIVEDLFPKRAVSVRKISLTYALMNLLNPFLGGIPTCHGSGGIAGHYAFGARTGGSVIMYGGLYLCLGLFFSGGFAEVILLFPKPILGMILLFEGLTILQLMQDMAHSKADLTVVFLVGLIAVALPYGYVIGLVGGTLLASLARKRLMVLTE